MKCCQNITELLDDKICENKHINQALEKLDYRLDHYSHIGFSSACYINPIYMEEDFVYVGWISTGIA